MAGSKRGTITECPACDWRVERVATLKEVARVLMTSWIWVRAWRISLELLAVTLIPPPTFAALASTASAPGVKVLLNPMA